MGAVKLLLGELDSRWQILKSHKYDKVQRFFAGFEIFCFPLSFISVLLLFLQLALVLSGIKEFFSPFWTKYISPVILAGAVGYLTNWLAIIMLFRPYDPVKWLFLWPQGMVPRNKVGVARAIGDQVGNKLLNPERMADEFSDKVINYLSHPDVIVMIREKIQHFLRQHQTQIIDFLIPQIESSLLKAIDQLITPENIRAFWQNELEPRLQDEKNRDMIALRIIEIGQDNAPALVVEIRNKLRSHLNLKFSGLPFSDKLADLVMMFFADNATLQTMIKNWLAAPETHRQLRDKMLLLGEKLREWMSTQEAESSISQFSSDAKNKLKQFISGYLKSALPDFAQNALKSEQLWQWIENEMLPGLKKNLIDFIHDHKQEIVDNLNIADRIEAAIIDQDVRKFHQMINQIAAQHLGAIQVLGFFLGVIIGLLQLVQNLILMP